MTTDTAPARPRASRRVLAVTFAAWSFMPAAAFGFAVAIGEPAAFVVAATTFAAPVAAVATRNR